MLSVSEASPRPDKRARILRNARTLILAVALALCIRTGLAQAYVVEGPSMEPTLENGERVLVVKFPFGLTLPAADEAILSWAEPDPGDVVILASPIDGTDLVKRVIGIAGDVVEIDRDVVRRNGTGIATGRSGRCIGPGGAPCAWREEQIGATLFRTRSTPGATPESHPAVIVPPGHVFVLGDHRDRSNDSRFFGVVPTTRIRGRVVM
jgi:signal peptidase I